MSWNRIGKDSALQVGFGKDPLALKCPRCGSKVWVAKGSSGPTKCHACGKNF